jgi:hypothetical protein
MTHVGQLAMLRRIAGNSVPPKNFIFAAITPPILGSINPSLQVPTRNGRNGFDASRKKPGADAYSRFHALLPCGRVSDNF